jgi:hypothetical protein
MLLVITPHVSHLLLRPVFAWPVSIVWFLTGGWLLYVGLPNLLN